MDGQYHDLEVYIEDYWKYLRISDTTESKTALGLPHPYYVPSTEVRDGFSFPHMYYWDSYFIAQGFWGTSREYEIVNAAENMFDLVNRLGFVPNSNSFSHLSRSQPPLLACLCKQVIKHIKPADKEWHKLAFERLAEEYWTVWMGELQPHHRLVHKGLSRYYDTNVLHSLAEAESGWDFTTRFDDRCLNFLPIDLNALLYGYETYLSELAGELDHQDAARAWSERAERRKATVNQLMWNSERKFFYDYDYRQEQIGRVSSLAAYTTMFSGLASDEQASWLVENLKKFETDFGLTTTSHSAITVKYKQWVAPNGWAPLHDIVVDGLLRYGYEEEARRIAQKWVSTVASSFRHSGVLYEKYDMTNPSHLAEGAVYPDQHGFGWTNGVTYKFIQMLKS